MSQTSTNSISFLQFLDEANAKGGFHNDDIVAVVLPLFEEVLTFHEAGKVAPLQSLQHILITNDKLDIDEHFVMPRRSNQIGLDAISNTKSKAFEVTGQSRLTGTVTDSGIYHDTNDILDDVTKPITHPVYMVAYHCYEHHLNHHDELTDIFQLGMILASVALGLDFNQLEELKTFVRQRENLKYSNQKLHPTIANLIVEMTELLRHRRSRDLYDIIERLKNYRNYNPETEYDLSLVAGFQKQDISSKQKWILNRLKSRLFDISRRNRLLYFKPNLRFVNLTAASVPNVVNISNIKPESLFTWNSEIARKAAGTDDIALSKYLRFEDNPYLPAYLDKLRTEAERDKREFGSSQLRLVACFLNWYNFKDNANERIQTPLVLIPVQLIKKKGVKDQYLLQPQDNEAEVNPVLVYLLKELYGLQLPDKINLAETSIETLFDELKKQIAGNNSGIILELIDKPRIKFIHTLAKQVLSQYNRRLRNRGSHFEHYKNLDYSYNHEHFQPLGLQLYRKYVEPKVSYAQWLIDENVKPAPLNHATATEKERTVFTLDNDNTNPYRWEFDLCNVVLGNFNYKKISLVSDYNTIAENNISSTVFNDIFSEQPKSIYNTNSTPPLPQQYPVVIADPTQTNAIGFSQQQKSYIIQGPPGTGKSQTITNLIADYVAQGKRVLFVCEKRAALDVVYTRLKQQKLDEVCCLIHDAREDKKSFILNLKETYEKYIKEDVNASALENERNQILTEMEQLTGMLQQYDKALTEPFEHIGVSLRTLLQRLLQLQAQPASLTAEEHETAPDYNSWLQFGHLVDKLIQLISSTGTATWAAHPLSALQPGVAAQEHPVSFVNNGIRQLQQLITDINNHPAVSLIPADLKQNFTQVQTLIKNAGVLKPLAQTNNLLLLDNNSARYLTFRQSLATLKQLQNKYRDAQQKNTNWLNKIPPQDIAAARAIAEKHEGSFFSFLNGQYRQLKKLINSSYNFSAHSVKPAMKQLLADLEAEYNALNEQQKYDRETRDVLQLDSLTSTELLLETIQHHQSSNNFAQFLKLPDAGQAVLQLAQLSDSADRAGNLVQQLLNHTGNIPVAELNRLLEEILKTTDLLPRLIPVLNELKQAPATFTGFVNKHPLSTTAMEATLAYSNLLKAYNKSHGLDATDNHTIQAAIDKLQNLHKRWLNCNARLILARQHQRFKQSIARSDASVAGQPATEKEWKKNYNEGRRVLENEFGKQMRYKAIRELATGNSGAIIKELKPVWLMSPLSVSDTLPVDSNFFDVVIFDEASQITLEEGIPPVFRAAQSIIVGDEMQMPPTNFFATTAQDPDDVFDETENEAVVLDADSLLTQAARKLPGVMLGWHYRSRYESLISFSNNAFYNAGLLTIPDKTTRHNNLNEIIANAPADAAANCQHLFNRSISYHYLPTSVYEHRTNAGEAIYIAHMVLTLIKQKCKESIGIVAFSQEQQNEIEDALETLAEQWKMAAQLEEAYQRTEDEQFVGLFVKNLENVQGDERDIIIMSVCYGYDSNKKMLMNFGPINRKGGEKRLNVIFSRAKKHMAVVASIKHTDIKNESNEGANYFRRFLQYAYLVSTGQHADATGILHTLANKQQTIKTDTGIVVSQIAQALNAQGYLTDTYLGQSYFKCQLGVRKNQNDTQYTLGILVDEDGDSNNVLEKYFQRPLTMQAFGWNIAQVWVKDWYHKKDEVLAGLLKQLNA